MIQIGRFIVLLALPGLLLSGCAGAQKKQVAERRVSELMQEFERAWETENYEQIVAHYSPEYRYSDGSSLDRVQRQAQIVCENPNIKVDLVLDSMEITAKDDLATVEKVRSRVTTPNGRSLFGLIYRLHKREGQWRIVWSDAWQIEQ